MAISSSVFNVTEPDLSPVRSACGKHFHNVAQYEVNNLTIFAQRILD